MPRNSILLLFLFALSLVSCQKEEPLKYGAIELQFKAYYDGQPLVMLEKYNFNDTLDILFQRFNFYLSNVQVYPVDNPFESPPKILDIGFVDFDGVDDTAEAEAGVVVSVEDLLEGNYKSIELGLGVPPDLNATKESDYPDTHPLGKESHYWTAWGSYIFTMINGKVDSDGDGVFDDSSVLYHLGSDAVYRTVDLYQEFSVKEGDTTRLTLTIDLHKLFKEGEGYMDIISVPATHTIDQLPEAEKVMDNFAAYLEVME